MSQSARRWLFRGSFVVTSISMGVLLMEAFVRIAGLDPSRIFEPDPVLGWRHVPGAVRRFRDEGDAVVTINSMGFRDRERQASRSTGAIRALILGDSMTACVQVPLEQTWCARLEARLNDAGESTEVFNLGHNGFSPIQELLLMKRAIKDLRPDLVALAVFLDNDVAGCDPSLTPNVAGAPYLSNVGGTPTFDFTRPERSFLEYQAEPINTIRRVSALYRLVSEARYRSIVRHAASEGVSGTPKRFELYRESRRPNWDSAWQALKVALREAKEEAVRAEVQFLVISVPAAQVVGPKNWAALLHQHPGMNAQQWNLAAPDAEIREFCGQVGIELIEPQDRFRAELHALNAPPLYFGPVGHFTSAGNALMSDALVAPMLERVRAIRTRSRLPR